MKNKRFFFASIAIICVSLTTIILKYPAEIYKWMVCAICGGYLGFQSWTDIKNGKDSNGLDTMADE